MYQYLEISTQANMSTLSNGNYLEMWVDNSDRKMPVVGIVKLITPQANTTSIFELLIQPQTGGDFAPLSLLHNGSFLTLSTNFRKVEFGKANVTRRWFEPALRTSWQNTPIPEANKIELHYERVFSQKEYDRIKLGLLSET